MVDIDSHLVYMYKYKRNRIFKERAWTICMKQISPVVLKEKKNQNLNKIESCW